MDQNAPLVFPGQSQSLEEESHTSPLPSSASQVPEDPDLIQKMELNPLQVSSSPASGVVLGSGDGSAGPVREVREAKSHLQSLVKERTTCEAVLTRQISGLSSSGKVRGEVEQLLEDAREEHQKILALTEQVQHLTGVTQSSRLRRALETWQDNIQEICQAITNNNNNDQDITELINNMVRTIRSIRTLIWTLASTILPASD